ncbi:MAG: hypothetical protein WDN49_14630 [Acetobacteraceae bacterium]
MDLIEAEDPDRLHVEPAGSGVRGDLLQRHVRKRKARRAEHEAAKESQVNAARHLQQRVEVGDRVEPAEPAGKAGAATAAQQGERVEHDAVANQVEHGIDLLRLGNVPSTDRGRSISQRAAPSFSSMAKRSRLRDVAITRTPALTAA